MTEAGFSVASTSGPGSGLALTFLFLGLALFAAIAALSHADDRAFSAAIVYLVLGAGAGAVIRVAGLGRVASPVADHEFLQVLTDVALVLALFSTGMRIRRRPTLDGWHLTLRLLGVALPATVAVVALWGWALAGLGVGAAIALGAALAPTDPVLAGDLGVAPPEEEEREREPEPEFVLTSEAGFNDGLALPFLLLGIAVAADRSLWRWAGVDLAYGVGVALVLGALLGRAIAVGASHLREREWLSGDFDRWVGLASAFLVFGAAEAVGALGFVAVFVAGIAFRRHELSHEYRRDVHDGADVLKHFGELAVILVLGSMLAVDGFSGAGGWGLALAPAAVFVIRPLVALATLVRSRLALRERIWVAWFGVKGIATLNYVSIAAGSSDLAGERRQLVWIVLPTIALSILVHGITASPLSAWLLRPDRRGGPRLQLLPHPGLVGQLLDLRRKLVAHHDPPAPPT